jgi:hypothetical protein
LIGRLDQLTSDLVQVGYNYWGPDLTIDLFIYNNTKNTWCQCLKMNHHQ